MHAPHCGARATVMRNRSIDAMLIPRISSIPPTHNSTGRGGAALRPNNRSPIVGYAHNTHHKAAVAAAMGPPGRFPFWRRGSKATGASQSTGTSSSGDGGGKDDGGAPRGFAAFYRALPPAVGIVRFFARDQVGLYVGDVVRTCVCLCVYISVNGIDRLPIDRRSSSPIIIRSIEPIPIPSHTSTHATHVQGGYFTCHGPDAAKIGREFYATDTVVRHQGAWSVL